MMPVPIALGLILCDYVIVEKDTGNVSLIGSFNNIGVGSFPYGLGPCCVFAALTGGLGNATVELTVTKLEIDEETYSEILPLSFPDRFAEVQVLFRLEHCEFETQGIYSFNLLVDGDWVAHRRVHFYLVEEDL